MENPAWFVNLVGQSMKTNLDLKFVLMVFTFFQNKILRLRIQEFKGEYYFLGFSDYLVNKLKKILTKIKLVFFRSGVLQ